MTLIFIGKNTSLEMPYILLYFRIYADFEADIGNDNSCLKKKQFTFMSIIQYVTVIS